MSLTTYPHCHHTHSRWSVYRRLNKPAKRSEKTFVCPHCQHISHLDVPHKRKLKHLSLLVRGLLPLIVMISFVMSYLARRQAMLLIVVYHFACFVGIIQYSRRKEETSQK